MGAFEHIGVFLNDEPGDEEAIAFAGTLAAATGAESISCVHVRGLEEEPSSPAPDADQLKERVLPALPEGVRNRVRVTASSATGIRAILGLAVDLDLDIMVVGRHCPHDQLGSSAAFYRLARKSPCSALVVPATAEPRLGRLLVLAELSEHCKMAVRTAVEIARGSRDARPEVVALASCHVGYGYSYTGVDFREACTRAESATAAKLAAFLEDVDVEGVKFQVLARCTEDLAATAYDLAAAGKMDAIVIGSRCATRPAAALLGSTAERVLASAPLPALIVKRKGETLRFLDALYNVCVAT